MSRDEVLERFHRALIEEIQTQRPEYLTGPFTVAEIYQNLVPYGSHRARIGVDMNADYEDALLRLLAGEGGFLVLESEPALRDIRAELDTSNPNTGLYREFAAVDVRLDQSRLDLSAAAIGELTDLVEELEADLPVPMNELAPAESASRGLDIVPPGVDLFEMVESSPDGRTGPGGEGAVDSNRRSDGVTRGKLDPELVEPAPERVEESTAVGAQPGEPCPWCRASLPRRETLNFCPFCGTDLALVPCPSCGDEVEPGWRFCASCGISLDG